MTIKSDTKKKRKNPWPARRRNKRYREINQQVDAAPEVAEVLSKSQDLLSDVGRTARSLRDLKGEYDSIMQGIASTEELFESLSIETLRDLYESEKNGRPNKPQFRDVVRANDIKRKGQKIIEEKQILVHDAQMVNIDLLQARIEALIKISEEEEKYE